MKRVIIFCISLVFFASSTQIKAQSDDESTSLLESTGLLGDNFSLEGALEVFKNAGTTSSPLGTVSTTRRVRLSF